jgi:glycosyltransferase involved in cell wall biosynthesis
VSRRLRALMGLMFYPRGGSAHVARLYSVALRGLGWDVRVVSASSALAGDHGDARRFYRGLDVHIAKSAFPLSYENRPGTPDTAMTTLDDWRYEQQVEACARALQAADATNMDVLHLNHLTPLNEAATRVAPDVPVVGHLHGTELLMLEHVATDGEQAGQHAGVWSARLQEWARRCTRLIVPSASQVLRVTRLLAVEKDRIATIPNGFDPFLFGRRSCTRLAHWWRHLVDAPQGWAPGEAPGAVAYTTGDLEPFAGGGPVLIYVGRFTAVKRVPLLIEAYTAARPRFTRRAPLVILGGFPNEWEGEHPLTAVRRTGARDVFLAGWHTHEAVPDFHAAADAVVLPSVYEQFGQALIEGMACGLPAIAVDAQGPAEIVRTGDTGWLVPPDDTSALTATLVEVVNTPAELRRRGLRAEAVVRARFSLPEIVRSVAALYAAACGERPGRNASAMREMEDPCRP